jgi:hypothetical protein
MTEEEAEIVGKTWREVRTFPGNRVCWCCFVEALCSEVELQEIDLIN